MGALAAGIGAGAGLLQTGLGFGAASAQRGWEERMANTQYQRGVADMRKAGLNPALMFGSGGPAPTPSVPVADVGGSVGSAVQGVLLTKQMANLDAEAFKKRTEGLVTAAQLLTPGDKSPETYARMMLESEISRNRSSAQQAQATADMTKVLMPAARVTGSKLGGYLKLLSPLGSGVSSAARLMEAF